MLKLIWDVKLFRFACVGVFNTLFDLTMLNFLVFLGHLPIIFANLISASVSMTVSYVLNHRVVFRSKDKQSLTKFVHFFVITGVGILGIQTLVIYGVTHGLAHQQALVATLLDALPAHGLSVKAFELNIAKLLAVAVAMTWNFMMYQLVIFKKTSQEVSDSDILL